MLTASGAPTPGAAFFNHLMPNIFPNLLRLPDLVVGMPVTFEIFRFAFVMPSARFQLKDRPEILKVFFFVMIIPLFIFIPLLFR